MSGYEFSLKQEVLLEKGADVLGALSRYGIKNGIRPADQTHPVNVMYGLVWSAKHHVLMAQTETELEQIDAQFDLARRFYAGIEAGADG